MNTYRYRIHYKSENSIGPATELKEIAVKSLKAAKDYAKQRALELEGRMVEVYKVDGQSMNVAGNWEVRGEV